MATDEELKEARNPVLPAWTQEPATPAQVGYIKGLIESRVIPESWLLRIKALTEAGLKKGDAGKIIQALKPLPLAQGKDDRSKNNPTIQDVPPGRYAVQNGQDANDLAFYRIGESESQSKSYKFVLQIAGPQEHLLKGQAAKDAVKRIVRAGIGDSAVLYGRKVGRCAICNTRITNRLSRELGLGPVCGGRVYGDWEERVNRARTALEERGEDPQGKVYV